MAIDILIRQRGLEGGGMGRLNITRNIDILLTKVEHHSQFIHNSHTPDIPLQKYSSQLVMHIYKYIFIPHKIIYISMFYTCTNNKAHRLGGPLPCDILSS